ncbi:MAG TPA: aminotransferase class I/II-fold pyridoxal phosphate-dependent enzyme [Acidimicrobiales bacterium]|jgi:histidinol-phosphate/aromatic aminotransferase/cobyric acid decarboxylase-like protein/imidazoleglycerol phosphate dehydratase HisB|nr:aminotransferase class I/II-fold pyridoxal phosphate-dependent enzyme [Acidimicrobiales bacterium]
MKPEALEAYQWPPSTDVIAERVGLDPRSIVRFDGNVAATPPPSARPAALARALADVNEYDRGRYQELREAIARLHGLDVDQVALGAGSDEFIVLLARVFAEGGTIATVPSYSYSMYRYAAIMAGATIIDDVQKADLVFVCRPNNPTGELPDVPDVPGQLVIDEAYAQYAGVDALDRLDGGAIVLRTFSKAYGLAGARVGYALANAQTTSVIASRQAPLSVSSLSAALALAALSTPVDVSSALAERDRLSTELEALGLKPLRSYTNFLFIPMDEPEKLVEQLLHYGAVTRAYPGGMRVSVRDEIDNDFLLDALRGVLFDTPMPPSTLRFERNTAETLLSVRLRVPGQGRVFVSTGAGFYDHMLQQLAFHAGMDLRLEGVGDLETGDHHTVEDMMRTFGEALDRALGDRKGLTRYGEARVPMDEALAHAVVDLSGRATAAISVTPDEGMVAHAFESLVQTARITLHVTATGENAHHVAEAAFKAVGRAMAQALVKDGSLVRSTKGSL